MRLLFYLRAVLADILIVIVTAALSIIAIVGSRFTRHPRFGDWVSHLWASCLLALAGVRVKVEGLENLPSGGAIFLFNHTSHFDIPVVHKAIPKTLRFGAKIELFKIPFFGPAMKSFGVLPIVRHKRDEVLKVYQESIEKVKSGFSYILAPEGTRQSGEELGPFKAGPFIFAIEGQIDLVPILLIDVHAVMPKGRLLPNTDRWSRTVKVVILKPVSTQGYTLETRGELQEKVRQIMVQAYNENRGSL